MEADAHRPVMLDEVRDGLAIRPAGRYVDGTFGRGGHARAVLEALGPHGRLLALDRDPQAIAAGAARFAREARLVLRHGSFADLPAHLAALGWTQVDGVLLDLGVSSPQLDDPARGFSFTADGPLDMRMDPSAGPSGAELLARLSETELSALLFEYGEERHARRIARAIVAARRAAPLRTTLELVEVVRRAVPRPDPHKHVATRTFQALRIAVNDELGALARGLAAAHRALRPEGRLVVLSFHSLEDRVVKRYLREHAGRPPGRREPARALAPPTLRLLGGPQRPGAAEVRANPRARSAVLRVAQRREAA
jgi:16S rRNA (cytosine1402-N4)-methyltransferase